MRYATAILGREAAEDACQDAWLRTWRSWGTADPTRLDAWFFRIVRNCCIDAMRRRRPDVALPDGLELPSAAAELDERVVDSLDAAAITPVLEALSPKLRDVLWLREAMDMTYAEIADVQGVPIGTVMSRLHAARKKAARVLRNSGR